MLQMIMIYNRVTGEFWSNEFGWTDFAEGEVFTLEEKRSLALPDGGEWACITLEGLSLPERQAAL